MANRNLLPRRVLRAMVPQIDKVLGGLTRRSTQNCLTHKLALCPIVYVVFFFVGAAHKNR